MFARHSTKKCCKILCKNRFMQQKLSAQINTTTKLDSSHVSWEMNKKWGDDIQMSNDSESLSDESGLEDSAHGNNDPKDSSSEDDKPCDAVARIRKARDSNSDVSNSGTNDLDVSDVE